MKKFIKENTAIVKRKTHHTTRYCDCVVYATNGNRYLQCKLYRHRNRCWCGRRPKTQSDHLWKIGGEVGVALGATIKDPKTTDALVDGLKKGGLGTVGAIPGLCWCERTLRNERGVHYDKPHGVSI